MPDKIENGQSGTPVPTNLTDSEIVKALECCTQGRDIKVCWDCPLYVDLETASACCEKLNANTLDLINLLQARIGIYETCNARKDESIKHLESEVKRLQAENKNLQERNIILRGLVDTQKAENERLKNHIKEGIDLAKQIPEMMELVKAEAHKEFAERLNKEFSGVGTCNYGYIHHKTRSIMSKEISEKLDELLLKELAGEDNES